MNKILKLIIVALLFASCTEFFNTDPDNIINEQDYISTDDEMYKGFLGILTRMQQAGDHAILLTDTRGDYLDITPNAPVELQDIYNYNPTEGNPYADPTCYYAIVIACNDFIHKMGEYRAKIGTSMDEKMQGDFNCLISSAMRIKVWAYYTIGRIYGKAVWFDDPLEELTNLDNTEVFTWINTMDDLVVKCLDYLDNGLVIYDGELIPSDLEMNWVAWLDAENQNEDEYGYWNYLVPTHLLLRSEILSWRGEEADWLWIRDNILAYLYVLKTTVVEGVNPGFYHSCNIPLSGNYYRLFYTEDIGYIYHQVAALMYDYENDQTNRLVDYFCPVYPGSYYLRPSTYAISKYIEEDIRGMTQKLTMNVINGDTCFTKYYYHRGAFLRSKIFEIMPSIILQRGHDYYFLLAEAENHLGNWLQTECLLNQGLTNTFPYSTSLPENWSQYYTAWFGDNGGYGDVGIVGCVRGAVHLLPKPDDPDYKLSEEERIKLYDLALADEYLLEYTGEGRSYSYLVKMAERYGKDGSIVADRVCSKYPLAKQSAVRASIEAGGYWVDWDLRGDND